MPRILSVSKSLELMRLRTPMGEEDFWTWACDAPPGFVAGWPMPDGTVEMAVKSASLKNFLASMPDATVQKASQIETPLEWVACKASRDETPSLSRWQTGKWS